MTRPIYEPSLTRKDSYLDFQQQQLFRRPAPAALDTPIAWAIARNISVATNVPDSASWTDMTMPDFVIATGQTALTSTTNGIQIDEDGLYLIEIAFQFNSGAGTGTWIQGAIRYENLAGSTGGRLVTQKSPAFNFDDRDECHLAHFYSIPGEQGAYPRIKASARQVGGGTTQTPGCRISVVQLTPNFADPAAAFAYF